MWVCLLLVGIGIAEVGAIRGSIQTEARHQAAARTPEEYRLPVVLQPAAPTSDLPATCTISLRPGWLAYILLSLVLWMFVFSWLGLFWPDHPWNLLLELVTSVALTILLSFFSLLYGFQRIVADEQGLTVGTPYRRQALPWREARMFAISATATGNNPPGAYR